MSLDACDVNVNPRQMELRPHGTADFPCGGYDTQIRSGEKGGVAWHWHEETEILYVTEGSVEVFLPDMRWTLSKGEGAFIHANVDRIRFFRKNISLLCWLMAALRGCP